MTALASGTAATASTAATAQRRRVSSAALATCFAVYVAFVVWAVLWKLDPPYVSDAPSHVVKLVPFVAAGGAGDSAPGEVFANIALFVPFGAALRALRPPMRGVAIAAMAAGFSVALETVQYVTGIGAADISDVVSNTGGALIGLMIAGLARALLPRKVWPVAVAIGAIGTLLVVAALAWHGVPGSHSPGVPPLG